MERFDYAVDELGRFASTVAPESAGGEITLDDGVLRVEFGDPPVFVMAIPRAAIRSVERLPDLSRRSRGVHGWRGKWLVNRSGRGLVRIALRPRVRARMKPALPRRLGSTRPSPLLRWLMRERTLRVRELTLAVTDPDGLVQALAN